MATSFLSHLKNHRPPQGHAVTTSQPPREFRDLASSEQIEVTNTFTNHENINNNNFLILFEKATFINHSHALSRKCKTAGRILLLQYRDSPHQALPSSTVGFKISLSSPSSYTQQQQTVPPNILFSFLSWSSHRFSTTEFSTQYFFQYSRIICLGYDRTTVIF